MGGDLYRRRARRRRVILSLVVSLAIAGCSGSASVDLTPTGNLENDLEKIAQFNLNDIDAATVDAKAHGDQAAIMCYPALRSFVVDLQAKLAASGQPIGPLSVIQRKRDVLALIQGGPPEGIKLACSAWALDELHQLNAMFALLARVGVTVAPIPIPP
jgi:hypothetical protein